jgi:hypothetical protein
MYVTLIKMAHNGTQLQDMRDFRLSTSKHMKTALFWVITQTVLLAA